MCKCTGRRRGGGINGLRKNLFPKNWRNPLTMIVSSALPRAQKFLAKALHVARLVRRSQKWM